MYIDFFIVLFFCTAVRGMGGPPDISFKTGIACKICISFFFVFAFHYFGSFTPPYSSLMQQCLYQGFCFAESKSHVNYKIAAKNAVREERKIL